MTLCSCCVRDCCLSGDMKLNLNIGIFEGVEECDMLLVVCVMYVVNIWVFLMLYVCVH